MLISLRPDVFKRIKSGEKIFEHRRVFPNETIKAYIYVSRPVQAIRGVMILGNKVHLKDWLDKYSYDESAVQRITEYMEHYQVVMEIQEFQDTNEITLSDIKKRFPQFVIPQMYYYLNDLPVGKYIEDNINPNGDKIENHFDCITSKMICVQ